MSKHESPSKTERSLLAIKQGTQQVLAAGKTISYRGKSYDQASLTQLLDGLLAPYVNVHDLRALMEKGVEDRRTNEPAAEDFVRLFKVAAAASYGEKSLEFSQFGFKPKKEAAELSPEQKQQKLERLRATRAARHTMGKRQKKGVKGDATPSAGPAAPGGSSVAKP